MTKMVLLAAVSLIAMNRAAVFDNDAPTLVMNGDVPTLKEGKFVYRDKAGAETLVAPDDIWIARSELKARNTEAANHRREKEAAIAKLAVYDGIDPVEAKDAFEKLSKIDQKKLIDSGEVDKVRNEIKTSFEGQLQTERTRADTAEGRVAQMFRSSAFNRSKFVSDRLIIPVDMVEAKFGANITFDKDGKMTPKWSNGETIYSRDPNKSGQPAEFDEALEQLVNAYPDRDKITKGSNNSGTDNKGGGGGDGKKVTITRDAWEKLPAHEQKVYADGARKGTHAIT